LATTNEVAEFPLVDGVAASSPDAILTPAQPPGDGQVAGLAFDPSGNLYVLVVGLNQVDIYPPGAKGNATPSGILNAGAGAASMTMDTEGYLYISSAAGVFIYAPGSTGTTPPVAQFRTGNPNGFLAMTMLGTTLYGTTDSKVQAYTNARSAPTLSRTYCTRNANADKGRQNYGVAILTSRLFVSQSGAKSQAGQRIAIMSVAKGKCPSAPPSLIASPVTAFEPSAIASLGTSVFVASNDVAYQLPAMRGKQAPVATMSGAALATGVFSIAIGP
jgi:hypothetical protein